VGWLLKTVEELIRENNLRDFNRTFRVGTKYMLHRGM